MLRPEDVKPFPKATARKDNIVKNGRKKNETRILTSIPVKNRIEQATIIMGENKTQIAVIKRKFSKILNLKKQIKLSKIEEELNKS